MKPKRIQLRRTKGWRMPPNTLKVDRTTKWGNPFRVGDCFPCADGFVIRDVNAAVEMFRIHLAGHLLDYDCSDVKRELRGNNLACWCSLDAPCHADVLLEIANS